MSQSPPSAGLGGEGVLAIDLGTSGVKVAVVDRAGRVVSKGQRPVETIRLRGGGAEQDPEHVWSAVVEAAAEAIVGAGNTRVTHISCCAQYSSIVGVDDSCQPVGNMVTWLDHRAAKATLSKLPGATAFKDSPWAFWQWIRIHGIPPLASGIDSLSHIRWISLAHPEWYSSTATYLEPVDYLTARLTGNPVSNRCSAFMMLLTDNRRPDSSQYSPRLIRQSGIDPRKLPDLVEVGAPIGTLRWEVADALGLGPGVVVWPGINDTQAGGVGSAAFTGDHAGLSMGTTTVMVTQVDFKRTDVRNSIVSMPSPVPGGYYVMAEGGIGGKAVEHFLDNVVFAADEFGDHSVEEGFEALHVAIEGVPAGSEGVLFLPWLTGSQTPSEDGRVRGGFLNLGIDTSRRQLGRAILEGVAFNVRWVLSAVERFSRRPVSELVLYGGGAVSDLWCQIIADVTDRNVSQTQEPQFVVCRGAALLGLERAGQMDWDEVARSVPVKRTYSPNPRHRRVYEPMYEQFILAYRRTRGIYRVLNS